MKVRIFLFHRVSPTKDALWQPMNPHLFERIIIYCKQNYFVTTIEELALNKVDVSKVKEPVVCIGFDDGYKDNIEYAAPILKKNDCPASFYIVTDCTTKNIPTWTFILDYAFNQTKRKNIVLDFDFLPEHFRKQVWNNEEEKLRYASAIKPYLKTQKYTEWKLIYEAVCSALNDVTIPEKMMMNWDDIRQLYSDGFQIGSHSVTHPLLGKIEENSMLKYELEGSAKKIETEIGQFPITISYPIGSYNSDVMQAAQEVGYQVGLAVNQTFYETKKDSIFAIPRVELYNENWLKTQLRLNGSLEWIKKRLPI